MMNLYSILYIICFFAILYFLFLGYKAVRKNITMNIIRLEFFIIILYLISILFFIIFNNNTKPYYERIDPVSFEYEAFAQKYSLVLYIFYFIFVVSAISIWVKNSKLPPLISVVFHSFLFIQIMISIFCIIQIVGRNQDEIPYSGDEFLDLIIGYCLFLMNIAISIILIIKTIKQEILYSVKREFKNNILNNLNQFLSRSKIFYPAIIILALPIFLFITLILILFGQDYNSMTKVFTETTTWAFSQKQHPPYLDHLGHYLCTVAACGNPKNVKPLFVGERHQNPIIVNRQLQIANAFEELIEVNFPNIHHIIRSNYDKYGYNLSKKINTKIYSDLTYYLMKPLEYFFLIFIYSFSLNPEILIQKQYQNR